MGLINWIKRVLGVGRDSGRPGSSSELPQDLREAANAKSRAANHLHEASREGSDLDEVAARKQRDAELLRQLAAEMELTGRGGESGGNNR